MCKKRTCLVILITLLVGFSSISRAQDLIYHTTEDVLKAIDLGIDARQENIVVLTDSPSPISDTDIIGKVGSSKFGDMSIRKGIDEISITTSAESGITKLSVFVKYTMSSEENKKIEEIARSWVNENIDMSMPAAVKIAVVNRFIANRLAYTLSWNNDDAYSAYYKQYGNSFGYADLASRYYTAAGIQNMIVTGAKPTNYTEGDAIDKGITASELSLRAKGYKTLPSDAIYAWNLVFVDGKWYHVDLPNFDGQFNFPKDSGRYFPEYTLNSSAETEMRYMWLKKEFPDSNDTWWRGNSTTHAFLKKMFDLNMYEYPVLVDTAHLDAYCADALKKGVARQDFIVSPSATIGDAPDSLSTNGGYRTNVTSAHLSRGKKPWYKMSCSFEYYKKQYETNIEKIPEQLVIQLGDTIDYGLLSGLSGIQPDDIKLISLTADKFTETSEGFVPAKEGHGYIGVESKNKVKIVKIIIRPASPRTTINGKHAQDIVPIMIDGSVYVPFKSMLEVLGATVSYDADKHVISATSNKTKALFFLDGGSIAVNDVTIPANEHLEIIAGKSYISINFISDYMGYSATWNAAKQLLVVNTESAH